MRFVDDGSGDLIKTFGPEDVFRCIYAVFHSPAYRERYGQFSRADFPRVPPPGEKSPIERGRVYIGKNDSKSGKRGQCFDGVAPEVWNFRMGGYQPLQGRRQAARRGWAAARGFPNRLELSQRGRGAGWDGRQRISNLNPSCSKWRSLAKAPSMPIRSMTFMETQSCRLCALSGRRA